MKLEYHEIVRRIQELEIACSKEPIFNKRLTIIRRLAKLRNML